MKLLVASPRGDKAVHGIAGPGEEFRYTRLFSSRLCLYLAVATVLFFVLPWESLTGPLVRLLAFLTAGTLRALGMAAVLDGQRVILPGFLGIEIAPECLGLPYVLAYVCAVLAFPTSWRSRLLGVSLGTLMIVLGNVLRLSSLVAIGSVKRSWFDFSHDYVWHALTAAAFALLWSGWLHWVKSTLGTRSGT